MTYVKMCGLRRKSDIEYVNRLLPEYIGYVFYPKSKRYISPEQAEKLTSLLDKRITPVGVFVNETKENIAALVRAGIIRIAQLHGDEDEQFIAELRNENIPVIKAFLIKSEDDIKAAERSSADYILLDSGLGGGKTFDHELLRGMERPYFLAGGLDPLNVGKAVETLAPYAVDVSSGIETEDFKDPEKMTAFINAVKCQGKGK